MTVSGSTDFELDVADYIEEAFERCGLEVRTGYDLKTAKRSMNLMFADWANRGFANGIGGYSGKLKPENKGPLLGKPQNNAAQSS